MKKIISLIMTGMMILTLTACTDSTKSDNAVQNTEQSSCLIVYFSQTGNTETIAGMIAEHMGGELFHVETANAYPDEYNDLIEVAKEEQDNDERPKLASAVEDMDRYQTVFIGYAGGIIGLN